MFNHVEEALTLLAVLLLLLGLLSCASTVVCTVLELAGKAGPGLLTRLSNLLYGLLMLLLCLFASLLAASRR